jgi:hypothetical protein
MNRQDTPAPFDLTKAASRWATNAEMLPPRRRRTNLGFALACLRAFSERRVCCQVGGVAQSPDCLL